MRPVPDPTDKLFFKIYLSEFFISRIFGLVCKSKTGTNVCHLFVEMEQEQPAFAIVDFINRYLLPAKTYTQSA